MRLSRRDTRSTSQYASTTLLLILIGCLVFLYRFNTLGGELGGFDNDHFINLARANQLLEGDWPLRDYADASLQGAWPPLTYLASAGAQLVFGRSLLAEALLTVGAVAAAAVFTTQAGIALGLHPGVAASAALVSVLPSVKLYGYARPILFAAAALLQFRYVNAPSRWRLAGLSLLSATAFLVRHDYAVYVGAGIVVTLIAESWRRPKTALTNVAAYAALSAVLVMPTIVGVHYLVGLDSYLEGARALAADEVARTNLKWPTLDFSNLGDEQNTYAWLYYTFLVLPVIAAPFALWRGRGKTDQGELAKVLGLAATACVANRFLLRGNLEARLPDPVVLHALLGAWILTTIWRETPVGTTGRLVRALAGGAATAVAVISVIALTKVGAAEREFRTAGFHEGPLVTAKTTVRTWTRLRDLPPDRWDPLPERGAMLAAAYLSECTGPADRIINTTYDADYLVFARRGFAAGRVNFVPGFYASEGEQREAVERASRQAAPLVFMDPPDEGESLAEDFPLFDAFLRERYVDAGTITDAGEPYMRVLALRGLQAPRTFANTGLPCFR